MKILLAMGAMAAVVLASGCGGDAKSGESAAKSGSGIPKVIRVGSETTFPPFEFTKDDKYVGFDLDTEFVLGYGLDYDGLGRNYKDIYKQQTV